MKITDITIRFEATQSLSGYCNVKPSVSLTAHLDEGDDPAAVKLSLLDEARSTIHEEIDNALIADDQPPRHYSGQRYQVRYNQDLFLVIVTPDETRLDDMPGVWQTSISHPSFHMRLDQAFNRAKDLARYLSRGDKTFLILDCSDGDLTRIPPLPTPPDIEPHTGVRPNALDDEDEEE